MRYCSGRRRQTGAVAVLAALAVGAGLVALALAIDVGRLYTAQRDLQRVANLAALDAARIAGGCMNDPKNPEAAAYNEAIGSINRNNGQRNSIAPTSVELGRELKSADGKRYFEAGPDRLNRAVRVTLKRPAPTRLMPLAPAAHDLLATAAARSQPIASVFVGSSLADLDPNFLNSFLPQGLGGGDPGLSLVSYTSLFEATVPVDAIIDTIGDGTPGSVDRRPVTVTEFLHDIVNSLGEAGNSVAAAAAQQIADASNGAAEILPEEFVAVGRDSAAALANAPIGAGDVTLLAAQSAAAQQGSVIDLLLGLPPPLGDSTLMMRVIDPGQIAPLTPGSSGGEEPAFASNTQAVLQANLAAPSLALGKSLQLPVWIELAQATASVTDIECARHDQPQDIVHVDARSSVSRLGIGRFDDINAPVPKPQPATLIDLDVPGGLPGLSLPLHVKVTGSAFVDIPADQESLVFTGPFPKEEQIGMRNSAALFDAVAQLPSRLNLDVDISGLGGPLDAVAETAIRGAEQTLQQALQSEIGDALVAATDPLARALASTGLTLGGADIKVYGVVAEEPYLFTR